MNKLGRGMLFIVLLSFVYFFFGMIAYQFLKPDITTTRTDLSCSSPATSGDMITCLIVDGVIPFLVIAIISTALGYITEKGIG